MWLLQYKPDLRPVSITKNPTLTPFLQLWSILSHLSVALFWLGGEEFSVLILKASSPVLIRRVPGVSIPIIFSEQNLLNLVLQVSWLAPDSPHLQPAFSPPAPLPAFPSALWSSVWVLVQWLCGCTSNTVVVIAGLILLNRILISEHDIMPVCLKTKNSTQVSNLQIRHFPVPLSWAFFSPKL